VRWDAHQLARVAEHAGWAGDDITTAVAVALATSGGLDTFEHRNGAPGSGRYVGLWGIDTDAHPAYAAIELHVPVVNAHAARSLCGAYGGWSWSPVWRAGHWRAYVDHAGTERTRTYAGQPVRSPLTLHRTDRIIGRMAETRTRYRRKMVGYGR
jgi:hypothetical protein